MSKRAKEEAQDEEEGEEGEEGNGRPGEDPFGPVAASRGNEAKGNETDGLLKVEDDEELRVALVGLEERSG